jgi:hypothetical protein
LKAAGEVIGGLISGGTSLSEGNVFGVAKAALSVAGGIGKLVNPSRTKCAAVDCPTSESPCVSTYCPRIGGEGGNGGDFTYGHGRTLSLAPNDVWFPGTGGGGGGGGGSSYIEGAVLDLIATYTNEEEGGCGGGAGARRGRCIWFRRAPWICRRGAA